MSTHLAPVQPCQLRPLAPATQATCSQTCVPSSLGRGCWCRSVVLSASVQPSKVQLKHSHWVPDGVCVVDNLKLVSMTFLRVAMCRRCVAGSVSRQPLLVCVNTRLCTGGCVPGGGAHRRTMSCNTHSRAAGRHRKRRVHRAHYRTTLHQQTPWRWE